MFKINTFYDLDRPNTAPDIVQSVPKKGLSLPKNFDKRTVVAPTREKLAKLETTLNPKLTPEESAKEKARILSLLERVGFDDAMRSYVQAVIQNKYVPKELLIEGRKVLESEKSIILELAESLVKMTEADSAELVFTMLGGEDAVKTMFRALPETVIEVPTNKEGTEVKKVSGMTLIQWMPEPLKRFAR